jgi:hypothetical protein
MFLSLYGIDRFYGLSRGPTPENVEELRSPSGGTAPFYRLAGENAPIRERPFIALIP